MDTGRPGYDTGMSPVFTRAKTSTGAGVIAILLLVLVFGNQIYADWVSSHAKPSNAWDLFLTQLAWPRWFVTSGGNAPMGVENLGGAVEAYLSSHFSGFPNGVPPPGLYHRILKEIEVPLLTAALAATRGNQIRAADLLGLNRNTLRKKIRDLDIQVYRSGG